MRNFNKSKACPRNNTRQVKQSVIKNFKTQRLTQEMFPPKICEYEYMYVQVCVGMYVSRWAGMHTACKGQNLTFCVVPQEPLHLWEPCTPDSARLAGQQASLCPSPGTTSSATMSGFQSGCWRKNTSSLCLHNKHSPSKRSTQPFYQSFRS